MKPAIQFPSFHSLRAIAQAVPILTLFLAHPVLWTPTVTAAERPVQSLEEIRQVVESYVAATEGFADDRPEIRVGSLDRRLRLTACSVPLEAFSASHSPRGDTLTVGVRCTAPKPWTVYVSARVRHRGPVVVTTRALARGAVISAGDLRVTRKDVSTTPGSAIQDPDRAIGKRLRRPVSAGAVLTENLLEEVPLIRRGQRVELVAGSGMLSVRMTGRALSDGAAGQRIRVRNVKSRKVVEGVVDPAGFVRTD